VLKISVKCVRIEKGGLMNNAGRKTLLLITGHPVEDVSDGRETLPDIVVFMCPARRLSL